MRRNKTYRMYIWLFLPLIFVTAPAMAQNVVVKAVVPKGAIATKKLSPVSYNIDQLRGKWQEVKRTADSTKRRISFQDSLQLDFNKRDSVVLHNRTSMSLTGSASVERNMLQVAGDAYKILFLNKNRLVINDGEFIRELHKRKIFYQETLGNIIIPKEDLTEPETINIKKAIGNWDVYRTQATPGNTEDSAVIKQLNFSHVNEDGSVSGKLTFIKANKSETLPLTAIFEKGRLQINTSSNSWNLFTYKADGKEFIFGRQGGLVYFARQL